MNLYNEIYNAINEGIQKALLINLEQNDVSINYSYHKINNSFNMIKDFNNAIKKLGQLKSIKKSYEYILNNQHLLEFATLYEVQSLDELQEIIKSIKKAIKSDKIFLKWIDTSNVLTLILQNGQEIPYHLYNNDNVWFIKLKNIKYSDHPLIMASVGVSSNYCAWCDKDLSVMYAKQLKKYIAGNNQSDQLGIFRNGWRNTYRNPNIWDGVENDFSKYPVFENIKDITFNYSQRLGYEAYLPASGEIALLYEYNNAIIDIYNEINNSNKENIFQAEAAGITFERTIWSSTEINSQDVWTFYKGQTLKAEDKTQGGIYIFPLFKKI